MTPTSSLLENFSFEKRRSEGSEMNFIQFGEIIFPLHPFNEEKLGTHLSDELSLALASSALRFGGCHYFSF